MAQANEQDERVGGASRQALDFSHLRRTFDRPPFEPPLPRPISPRAKPGFRSPSTCPPRRDTDSDHPLARGEVGKGRQSPSRISATCGRCSPTYPLATMNTSMTINATAPWLMALYIAVADEQGAPRGGLQGTTQNDIIKEYLSRGAYVFPPGPSLRLTKDLILFCARETPKWNPMNVCSYHLAGGRATPVQELAYALANAAAVLDAVKSPPARCRRPSSARSPAASAFSSMPASVSSPISRKMRAFVELWDEISRDRYGIAEDRRFRCGVQVNSLGLTEQQPENNVYRILMEMLAVVLSKDARARPCNCRPGTRPWACRGRWTSNGGCACSRSSPMRRPSRIWRPVRGRPEVAAKVADLAREAMAELAGSRRWAARSPRSSGLHEIAAGRVQRAALGRSSGASRSSSASTLHKPEPSPLTAGRDRSCSVAEAEAEQIGRLDPWRAGRDAAGRGRSRVLRTAAASGGNIMDLDRSGEGRRDHRRMGRGPARDSANIARRPASGRCARQEAGRLDPCAARSARVAQAGRRMKLLVGKPGLDGHSNGAEQIAARRHRRGDGRRLRRHPPHAGGDCRARRGRASIASACRSSGLAPGDGARGSALASGRPQPHSGDRRRHHLESRRRPVGGARAASRRCSRPRILRSTGLMGEIVQEVEARFDADQAVAAGRAHPKAADTTIAKSRVQANANKSKHNCFE